MIDPRPRFEAYKALTTDAARAAMIRGLAREESLGDKGAAMVLGAIAHRGTLTATKVYNARRDARHA